MLKLAACSAVLAGDVPSVLRNSAWLQTCEAVAPEKAVSSAAAYALETVKSLSLSPIASPAVYTFSGPSGSTMHLFDRAWKASPDGRLVGEDFARRSRKIHPFTLLLSLNNQVAATLSLKLGLTGPTMNLVDAPASFVDMMPNMASEVGTRPVLAVLSSATNRAEERTRMISETGCASGIEGAVALLFTRDGGLAELAPDSTSDSVIQIGPGLRMPDGHRWPFGPCLEAGLGVLWALTTGTARARFEIGTPQRKARFSWNTT